MPITPQQLIDYMKKNNKTDYAAAAKEVKENPSLVGQPKTPIQTKQPKAVQTPTPQGLIDYMKQNKISDYTAGAQAYKKSIGYVAPSVSTPIQPVQQSPISAFTPQVATAEQTALASRGSLVPTSNVAIAQDLSANLGDNPTADDMTNYINSYMGGVAQRDAQATEQARASGGRSASQTILTPEDQAKVLTGYKMFQPELQKYMPELEAAMKSTGGDYKKFVQYAKDKNIPIPTGNGFSYTPQQFFKGISDSASNIALNAQVANANQNPFQEQLDASRAEIANAPEFAKEASTKAIEQAQTLGDSWKPERIASAMTKLQEASQKQAYEKAKTDVEFRDISPAAKWIGDNIGYQTGQMIPSIAATAVTGNPLVGYAVLGMQAKNAAMQDAVSRGASYEVADQSGTMQALIEIGTEAISGGIGGSAPMKGLSGFMQKQVAASAFKNVVKNPAVKFMVRVASAAIPEGLEEVVSSLVSPFFERMYLDPNAPQPSIDELIDTFIKAGAGSLVFSVFGGGGSNVTPQVVANNVQKYVTDPVVEEQLVEAAQRNVDFYVNQSGTASTQAEDVSTKQLPAPQPVQNQQPQNLIKNEVKIREPKSVPRFDFMDVNSDGILDGDFADDRSIAIASMIAETANNEGISLQEAANKFKEDAPTRADLQDKGLRVKYVRRNKNGAPISTYADFPGIERETVDAMKRNEKIDALVKEIEKNGTDFLGVREDADGSAYFQYGDRGAYDRAKGTTESPFSPLVQMKAKQTVPIQSKANTISKPVQAPATSEAAGQPNIPIQPKNAPAVATQPAADTQTKKTGGITIQHGSDTYNVKAVSEKLRAALPEADQTALKRVERIAKKIGVNVQAGFEVTRNGEKINGMYNPNNKTLYLALDTEGDGMYYAIAGHEITHALSGSDAYKTMLDYAVEIAKKDGSYDSKMATLQKQYGTNAEPFLHDELVSNTIQEMFRDPALFRKIERANSGFAGRLIQSLDNFIAKLKGKDAEPFTQLRKKLQDAIDETQIRESRRAEAPRESRRTSNVPGSTLKNPNLEAESAEVIKVKTKLGEYDYTVKSNKESVAAANRRMEGKSIQQAIDETSGMISSKERFSAEDIAFAELALMKANTLADKSLFAKAEANLRIIGTEYGQGVQIFNLINKMSPEGRWQTVKRIEEKLNAEAQKKTKGKKGVKADGQMMDDLLDSTTPKEAETIEKAIRDDLDKQMPVTLADKLNAWRYLSMLGNPRTHLRNITGNATMYMLANAKNMIGATIESTATALGAKIERTKSIHNPLSATAKAAREFADKYVDTIQTQLRGNGKEPNAMQNKRIFNNAILEFVRSKAMNALEIEDWKGFMRLGGLRQNAKHAMAAYMIANKLTPEQMTGETLDKAFAVILREAQRNTFRDASAVADALNKLSRIKGFKTVVEGVVPFKKTPFNILKRGIEYSPLGLVKGMAEMLSGRKVLGVQMKGDTVSAAQIIDSFSAGLAGTAITMLGYLLKASGILRTEDDKDKEEYFNELQGRQPYSIQIGDTTYTLDWLTPTAMPLFVGAEIYDAFSKAGWNVSLARTFEALSSISDPLMQMSMLQGLEDAMTSSSEGKLGSFVGSAAFGYLGQFVPTFFGQFNRVIDPVRRTYYSQQDSDWTKMGEQFARKIMAKIPGLTFTLQPYVDMWGEEQSNDDFAMRFLENMVFPWYQKEVDSADDVNMELERLYVETNEISVLPNLAPTSYYDSKTKKTYYIPSDEIAEYRKNSGQAAKDALDGLVDSAQYKALPDADKVKLISDIYSYAGAYAKSKSSMPYTPSATVKEAMTADEKGIDVEDYYLVQQLGHTLQAEYNKEWNRTHPKVLAQNKKNETGNSVSQETAVAAIRKIPNLSNAQRAWLYWSFNAGWKSGNPWD